MDSFDDEDMARTKADGFNLRYQSNNYYVEKFDPDKLTGWTPTHELTNEELFPQW